MTRPCAVIGSADFCNFRRCGSVASSPGAGYGACGFAVVSQPNVKDLVMKSRRLLPLAIAALFAASGAAVAQDKQKDRSASGGAGAPSPNAPVIVLVPLAIATTSTFA